MSNSYNYGTPILLQSSYDPNLCLSVAEGPKGASANNGHPLELWSCDTNDPSVQFILNNDGTIGYPAGSNTCLGVQENSTGLSTPIISWSCNKNDPSQQFEIQPNNSIKWKNQDRYLSVSAGNFSLGGLIKTWTGGDSFNIKPLCDSSTTVNSSCDSYYQNYCSTVSNINNDPNCKKWINDVGVTDTSVQTVMLGYCGKGDNMANDPICSQFCKDPGNSSSCDTMVKKYCVVHPNDTDLCGCFNLPDNYIKEAAVLESKGLSLTPQCNANSCNTNPTAYIPSNYKNYKCPTQQICVQGIDLGSVGGSVALTGISETCNQTVNSSGNTSQGNTSQGNTSQGNKPLPSNSNTSILIWGMLALILIIILISSLFV